MTKEHQIIATLKEAKSVLDRQSILKSSSMFSEKQGRCLQLFGNNRPSLSAPQSRSSSMRKVITGAESGKSTVIRRNSLPLDCDATKIIQCNEGNFCPHTDSQETFQRIRSFKLTSKGLVNHGDSFRNRHRGKALPTSGSFKCDKRQRLPSETSNDTDSCSSSANEYYRIAILGSHSVGKTTLMNQFMTSEYIGGQEDANGIYIITYFFFLLSLYNSVKY